MSNPIIDKIWFLIKESIIESVNDNTIKLSASLSYYTIFSLPPLLIIVIYLAGLFFGTDAARGEIFGQINGFVGSNVALQIQEIIKNIKLSTNDKLAYTVGIITLLIAAMGVFVDLQDSINLIWRLKVKSDKELKLFIKNRLISFVMIGSMGFLLLVGLIINVIIDIIIKRTTYIFSDKYMVAMLFHFLNTLALFLIVTLLFTMIFRTLPDGDVSYKDSIFGAAFTSFLFMIGKFIIGAYIGRTTIVSFYGAAGSLIVILLWIYYSSIILYFGVEFTKVYACSYGDKIIPKNYAVFVDKKEIEYR